MKRSLTILAVAAFLGLSFAMRPAATTDAQGAGCIKISRVYFDSPGSDTGSNTSLNAEWIKLRNGCASGKSLNGWTVRDTSSHVYRFDAYTLRAGGYVKIHTGNGADTAGHRYWDADGYVWNNSGDTAKLKNAAGTLKDRCQFSGAGSSAAC